MSENKTIPVHKSYEEMAEFWDSHSLSEYWEQTEPAEFEVTKPLQNQILVPVNVELLENVRQIAHSRGVSTERLVNTFLEQQIHAINAD